MLKLHNNSLSSKVLGRATDAKGFRTAEAVFKFTPFKETYVNLKQNMPKQAIWNCNEDILDIPSLFQLYKVFA